MKYKLTLVLRYKPSGTSYNLAQNSNDARGLSAQKFAHRFPQFEQWVVVSISNTGGYTVKNQDGSSVMRGVRSISTSPGIPNDPEYYEIGTSVKVGFYDCDRRKPYIFGLGSAANGGGGVEPPAIPVSEWRTWRADYFRSNSWTVESDFDWTIAEEVAGPVADCIQGRYENPPGTGYPWIIDLGGDYSYGNHTWFNSVGIVTESSQYLSDDSDASYETLGAGDILDAAEIYYDEIEVVSMSRIGGWCYLEIRTVTYGDTFLESVYATRINISRFDEGFLNVSYVTKLSEGAL